MRTTRLLLLLLALQGTVTEASDAICNEALTRHNNLLVPCSRPNAQATTCTNKDACASAITSINDATLSSMKTGFTACGNVPGKEVFQDYATSFNYVFVYQLASSCGVPASTVALTLPAPDTCDGAYTRFVILSTSCSAPNAQATTCTSKDACASAITSINDATLSSMKTGFTACGNVPGQEAVKQYATSLNYDYLSAMASSCGVPASTVNVKRSTSSGTTTLRTTTLRLFGGWWLIGGWLLFR
jgi:hypothetical protein